jgi:exodeoxyribonuclease III
MADDAWQGMLFAAPGAQVVDDSVADRELRLCALNINSPSTARAHKLLDWLLASECNTLVLTELQPTDGGRLLRTGLDAEGFTVTCTPGWQSSRYLTTVATKGFAVTVVEPPPPDPRVVAVDLTSAPGTLRLVGVYGLTNGMNPESSHRRREFQHRLLAYLTAIQRPGLCVAGDLNIVEPGHRPPLPAFEPHDYACYTALLNLGLRDAYRICTPDGEDHSWFSTRFGNQRLDHAFLSDRAGTLRECRYDHTPRTTDLTDHAALRAVIQLHP